MQFGILGPLCVTGPNGDVSVSASKLRTLLAALLLRHPAPIPPAGLTEVLWGDGPAPGAEATVYVYVSRLRQLLGREVVVRSGAGYELAVESDRIDARRFEGTTRAVLNESPSLCPADTSERLGEALALWRGPALAEFRGWQWAEPRAVQLDELRLSALERRIDADLAHRDSALLASELEALVAENPFREGLCGQLMVALYRCRRQADALAAYAVLRDRLADELGILPSPPLQRLERAVLLQDPGLGARPAVDGTTSSVSGTAGAGDAHAPLGTFLLVRVARGGGPGVRAVLAEAGAGLARFGGSVVWSGQTELVARFGSTEPVEDHAARAAVAGRFVSRSLERALLEGWCILDSAPVDRAGSGALRALAEQVDRRLPPGSIAATQAAAHLLRRDAVLEPLASRASTAGATISHRVLDLVDRSVGEIFRFCSLSPFVGRRRELDQLMEHLAAVEDGHGQAVGISGDPGMGKSRLLYELRRRAEPARVRWIEGRATSYGTRTPYSAVTCLLRDACGIGPHDDVDGCASRVERAVARAGCPPGWSADLLEVLGGATPERRPEVLDPEAHRDRLLDTIRRFLLRLAERRPLVIAIEDVHWIDPTSEAVLAAVAESLIGARVLLIATHRPGHRPAWAAGSYASQLTLRRLCDGDAAVVVAASATEQLSSSAADRLIARAEGNPLFLEELTRSATMHGEESVPDTLAGVVRASIDTLADGPRRVLQAASVLGRSVPTGLLHGLCGDVGLVEPALRELRHRELLYESTAAEDGHHVFRHALTRDVAYATIPSARREALHARVAGLLEADANQRGEAGAFDLAHHFARSGQAEAAVRWLRRAAEAAVARHGHEEALAALDEAAQLAPRLPTRERDRTTAELLLAQADSLFLLGRLPEVLSRLAEGAKVVDRLERSDLSGPYHFWLAHAHCLLGHAAQCDHHAQRALQAAAEVADAGTAGRTHYVLSVECLWTSRHASGAEHGRRAVALLRDEGSPYWTGMAHWAVAINLCLLGRLDEALAELDSCGSVAVSVGDARLAAYASWTRGLVLAHRGDLDRAALEAELAVERARDPYTVHACRAVGGYVQLLAGDVPRGLAELEEAVPWIRSAGFSRAGGWFLAMHADALLEDGQVDRAVQLVRRALEEMSAGGFGYGVAHARRTLARLSRRRGEVAAAASMEQAAATFAEVDAELDEAVCRAELAGLYDQVGAVAEAQRQRRRAQELYCRCGATARAARLPA